MQKKLMAIAVGATIAAAPFVAAQADVKLRGMLEVEVVNTDGGKLDSVLAQGDKGGRSRVFIDASKDLGNGMKAFGRYAWKLDPSNGDQFAARDQYVGLKGNFGAIKFGRMPTPYKMNGGVKWDPFTATFLEARRSGGMSGDSKGHNGFENDIMQYVTPKFAGMKLNFGYIGDETATGKKTTIKDGELPSVKDNFAQNGTFLFGGTGVWGPISAIAAYSNFKQRQVGSSKPSASDIKQTKIGIRYKANGLVAALQYEDVDKAGSIRVNGNRVGAVGAAKITYVNLGYKFGNTLITGSYGNTDAESGLDVGYGMIGATYFFAKKVRGYVGYATTEVDAKTGGSDKYKMIGAGLRYDF